MGLFGKKVEAPQDYQMLDALGMGEVQADPTASVYDQLPKEPHVGTYKGELALFNTDGSIYALTPEQARQYAGIQPDTPPTGPGGFTEVRDSPTKGRISATVSLDYSAETPDALPDARMFAVNMLLGGTQRLEQQVAGIHDQQYFDNNDNFEHFPAQQPGYGMPAEAAWSEPADGRQDVWGESWQTQPEEAESWDEQEHDVVVGQAEPVSRRQERKMRKQSEKWAREAGKAIAGEITSNPMKIVRLGIAAVLFTGVYNATSGRYSMSDMSENVTATLATPWNATSDAAWGIDKIIKIVK